MTRPEVKNPITFLKGLLNHWISQDPLEAPSGSPDPKLLSEADGPIDPPDFPESFESFEDWKRQLASRVEEHDQLLKQAFENPELHDLRKKVGAHRRSHQERIKQLENALVVAVEALATVGGVGSDRKIDLIRKTAEKFERLIREEKREGQKTLALLTSQMHSLEWDLHPYTEGDFSGDRLDVVAASCDLDYAAHVLLTICKIEKEVRGDS